MNALNCDSATRRSSPFWTPDQLIRCTEISAWPTNGQLKLQVNDISSSRHMARRRLPSQLQRGQRVLASHRRIVLKDLIERVAGL